MKNLKSLDEAVAPNREGKYQTSEEISGYDNAIVLYLNDPTRSLPNKIRWINSIAKEANCKAVFAGDNIVVVTSNDSDGDHGDLKKFKKLFEL